MAIGDVEDLCSHSPYPKYHAALDDYFPQELRSVHGYPNPNPNPNPNSNPNPNPTCSGVTSAALESSMGMASVDGVEK